MNTLNRLISFIKQHALFSPKERILLAVSGGRDSVLMAHLFKESGFEFGIAHCNFNLRGEESRKDEQFTKNLALELNMPFFTTIFDTSGYSKQHHVSVQMAARDLRYEWLEKLRFDFNFQYIAIAQHQNDVMETMILNLTRGTGIAGMHGILPKKDKIIRPLLFLTREEINQEFDERGFLYREDGSNNSTKYARNKIRLEVIPALKELNPSLEQTFEANRKRFEELEIMLEMRLKELKTKLFKEIKPDEYEIDILQLKALVPMDTLLFGLFHPYGFTESILRDFKRSWQGEPGKIFSTASHDLYLDRTTAILTRKEVVAENSIRIEGSISAFSWNDETYQGFVISAKDFTLKDDSSIAQLDFDLLKFPMTLRNWNEGDRFHPLGVKGTKKLSDFFIEQKIPLARKKNIGILENGNGDIIWIAGFRIGEHYKITANTKKVFIFEQSK